MRGRGAAVLCSKSIGAGIVMDDTAQHIPAANRLLRCLYCARTDPVLYSRYAAWWLSQ